MPSARETPMSWYWLCAVCRMSSLLPPSFGDEGEDLLEIGGVRLFGAGVIGGEAGPERVAQLLG